MEILDLIRRIADSLTARGGRAFLVGGCVRDDLLGLQPKDFDLEVYGLTPEELIALLSKQGCELDLVGKSFGVIKIRGVPLEVSIPRRESKLGLGHRGFEILSDPAMAPAEACLRRDFTINAMLKDPLTGEVLDPVGGRPDLEQRILRPTSERFKEDPLRVLRAMQFIARFDLTPAPLLLDYSREMTLEGLARERIFEEFCKLILKGVRIKKGLEFLKDSGWIRYFPEIAAMVGTPQDPVWHPEGDVFVHTGHCLDEFARQRSGNDRDDLVLGLAVLLHDVAKPVTTEFLDGRWRSYGHEERGREVAASFLKRLTEDADLLPQVVELVCTHMRPTQLFDSKAGDAAIRRLAMQVGRLDLLGKLVTCDKRGRPPLVVDEIPEVDWLLAAAQRLAIEAQRPKPLLLGRHLLPLGFQPGRELGEVLHAVFEAQLDGKVTTIEEGILMARELGGKRGG